MVNQEISFSHTCWISFSISPARITSGPRTAYSILTIFGFIESNVNCLFAFPDVAIVRLWLLPYDVKMLCEFVCSSLINAVTAVDGWRPVVLLTRCSTEFKHLLVIMVLVSILLFRRRLKNVLYSKVVCLRLYLCVNMAVFFVVLLYISHKFLIVGYVCV